MNLHTTDSLSKILFLFCERTKQTLQYNIHDISDIDISVYF